MRVWPTGTTGWKIDAMITVGLPFHNARDFLAAAVRSVRAQSVDDWELILVDDGSTDGSAAVAEAFTHDPRIRLLADGQNRGLAARLNQIAALAVGEYLVRMDADDLMFPDRLQRQSEYLAAHPDCDILGGAMVVIDAGNRVRAWRRAPARIETPAQILRGHVPLHPTVAGRTEWFRQNRYDEAFIRGQDFELWSRLAGKVTIHNLQDPVLFYREYGVFSWRKYREHSRITRRLLRERGPRLLGPARTRTILLQRRCKDAVYAALACAGATRLAVRLRNMPVPNVQAAQWQTVADCVKHGTNLS